MSATQQFVFALVEDYTHLTFSCAVDPLRIANLISGEPLYRWSYASANGNTVQSSDGTVSLVHHAFNNLPDCDRLFVLAGSQARRKDLKALLSALRHIDRHGRTKIGALCSGAQVLAEGGFLTGRRAAIHWECHESFAEAFPEVDLVESVFVADEKYVTASGGTATADLMLHLIEQDHGYDLSVKVADQMVYNAVRAASAPQKVSFQSSNGIRNPHLARAIETMRVCIEEPLPTGDLAKKVGVSPRQLERLFVKYLSTTPKRYYMEMRLEKARRLLVQTEMSITELCFVCGFQSVSHFSRAYRMAFGVTPRRQRGRLG